MRNKLVKRACALAYKDWQNDNSREDIELTDKRLKPDKQAQFIRIYRSHLADLHRYDKTFQMLKNE